MNRPAAVCGLPGAAGATVPAGPRSRDLPSRCVGVGYVAAVLGGLFSGGCCAACWIDAGPARRRRRLRPARRSSRRCCGYSTTGYLVMSRPAGRCSSNARATELGVLHAGIVDAQILAAAGRAAVSGEQIDVELRPVGGAASLTAPRTAPTAVLAVVRLHR